MVQDASQNQQPMPRAANLGLARPPAIYLIAILLGLALHFAWPIRFVPNFALLPAIVIISFVVTPREEHYLEVRFGKQYATYKGSVRRWL